MSMNGKRVAIVCAVACAGLFGAAAWAGDAPAYVPQKGDEVVVYTHHFKPEFFAEGVKLAEEGFRDAAKAAGQTRHFDFLLDPNDYELVVVSFFAKGSSADDWHKHKERIDVVKKLETMWSEPQKIHKYEVDGQTNVLGAVK